MRTTGTLGFFAPQRMYELLLEEESEEGFFGLVSSKTGSRYFRSWKSSRFLYHTDFLLFYSCQKYHKIPTNDQGTDIVKEG